MNSYQKCLVYFFSLFAVLNTSAQKTEFSNAIKLNNKLSKFRILGKTSGKIIVERYGNNTHFLDAYNSKLRVTSSKQVPIEKNDYLKSIWVQPEKSWVIKLQHEKNNSLLKAIKFDENIRFSDKAITLDTIAERRDLLESNLRTQLSLNETKLLFYTPIFNQGKIDYFYTSVYDDNLKLLVQKKLNNSELINFKFVKAFLLNNGSYLFITAKEDNKEFFLTFVSSDGDISTHAFNPIKNVFKKLEFQIDETNDAILISGFFSKENESKKERNGAEEFFITKIDLNTYKTVYTEIVPFTDELYFNLTGKPSQLSPPQLFTFYIHSIVPKNDGGAIIFAESYFKNEEEYLNNSYFSISGLSNYTTSTIYNYNDIIVYHINDKGVFTDYQVIRKKQVSQNDYGSYSSFYIANLQDELKLIYLEEILTDSHLSQSTINEVRKASSLNILNIGNKSVLPIVNMSKQTSPNEIITPSFFKNKLQLIKIIY